MITKFKIFENKITVEVGDYVLLDEPPRRNSESELNDFVSTNIAQVTKVYYPGAWFSVKFENEPEWVTKILSYKGEFNVVNIRYISKNKEDLEAILKAKEYNV